MSTVRQELALAARRSRVLIEALPERLRPDIAVEWGELLEAVEDARTPAAAHEAITAWRERVEAQLTARLANAPHDGGNRG